MRFGSICSGIEAASAAWEPIGWKAAWFSEIEPGPCSVLSERFPDTPNYGDMTTLVDRIESEEIEAPDILCGGTPCQAFSVAGNRKSLSDDRGNLSLIFCEIANAIDNVRRIRGQREAIIFWENVPGVLNTQDNAFGCFLAALAGEDVPLNPAGERWTNSGCVYGPQRAIAWRVLDAQYFGLAQRRKRVFVVASARDGFDPAQILFEFEGMRRDYPPSRKSRNENPENAGSCAQSASHWDGEYPHPTLNQSHNTGGIGASNQEVFSQRGAGLVPDLTGFRMLSFGEYRNDETASAMKARDFKDATDLVVHLVGIQNATRGKNQNGLGVSKADDPMYTPDQASQHAVCVHGTQDPNIRIETAHTLGRNSGQENAVFSFAENSRAEIRLDGGDGQRTGALSTGGGKPGQGVPMIAIPLDLRNALRDPEKFGKEHREGLGVGQDGDPSATLTCAHVHGVATNMLVRRLTPLECERLQGFPDNWTLVTHKGKPMPDGPRYKAIGNSWAVAVVRWIGVRINNYIKEVEAA